MTRQLLEISLLTVVGLSLMTASAVAQQMRVPNFSEQRVIAEAQPNELRRYLAFPAVLDLGKDVLVSFKRGRSHANDTGAGLDFVRLEGSALDASKAQGIARLDDAIMQMGEWIKFSNGDIANFVDSQREPRATRIGLRSVRSTNGGKTFGKVQAVGLIGGVEYGYAFDSIISDNSTIVLVMRFSNLPGGKPVVAERPHAGSVDVIRTNDNGSTWEFVNDLSHEFGNVPINESAFVLHPQGYLVTTRGYDSHQRLHLTDANCRSLQNIDLTQEYPMIEREIGRPRLFQRDGNFYLLGRNWTKREEPMRLCLFRVDAQSLKIKSGVILDNAEGANVTDGYYANLFWREQAGRTFAHVITYKALDRAAPKIIQLTFDWSDLK